MSSLLPVFSKPTILPCPLPFTIIPPSITIDQLADLYALARLEEVYFRAILFSKKILPQIFTNPLHTESFSYQILCCFCCEDFCWAEENLSPTAAAATIFLMAMLDTQTHTLSLAVGKILRFSAASVRTIHCLTRAARVTREHIRKKTAVTVHQQIFSPKLQHQFSTPCHTTYKMVAAGCFK